MNPVIRSVVDDLNKQYDGHVKDIERWQEYIADSTLKMSGLKEAMAALEDLDG